MSDHREAGADGHEAWVPREVVVGVEFVSMTERLLTAIAGPHRFLDAPRVGACVAGQETQIGLRLAGGDRDGRHRRTAATFERNHRDHGQRFCNRYA